MSALIWLGSMRVASSRTDQQFQHFLGIQVKLWLSLVMTAQIIRWWTGVRRGRVQHQVTQILTHQKVRSWILFFFTENNIGLNLISYHLGVLTNPPSKYSEALGLDKLYLKEKLSVKKY